MTATPPPALLNEYKIEAKRKIGGER